MYKDLLIIVIIIDNKEQLHSHKPITSDEFLP